LVLTHVYADSIRRIMKSAIWWKLELELKKRHLEPLIKVQNSRTIQERKHNVQSAKIWFCCAEEAWSCTVTKTRLHILVMGARMLMQNGECQSIDLVETTKWLFFRRFQANPLAYACAKIGFKESNTTVQLRPKPKLDCCKGGGTFFPWDF